MDDTPKTRRRWFRFSLRTMMVLVSLVCIFCGYLGWAMNWKRQREAFLETKGTFGLMCRTFEDFKDAPYAIRLLGEGGYNYIYAKPGHLEEARELFPEAEVFKDIINFPTSS